MFGLEHLNLPLGIVTEEFSRGSAVVRRKNTSRLLPVALQRADVFVQRLSFEQYASAAQGGLTSTESF